MFYFSVSLACGATTSENCTYLSLASTATVAGTACTYTICPATSTVSRIKLDLTVNFKFCLNPAISPTATQLGTQINILVNNPSEILASNSVGTQLFFLGCNRDNNGGSNFITKKKICLVHQKRKLATKKINRFLI